MQYILKLLTGITGGVFTHIICKRIDRNDQLEQGA